MFLAQALPKRSVPAFPELLFLGQSDPIGVRSQLYTIGIFFAKVWLPPVRKGVKYGQSFTNRVSNVKTKEDFILNKAVATEISEITEKKQEDITNGLIPFG